MPYITDQEKRDINAGIPAKTMGQLNYTFCMVILCKLGGRKSYAPWEWDGLFYNLMTQYIDVNGKKYQRLGEIVGAAVGAYDEVSRKTAGDYGFARVKLMDALEKFKLDVIYPYEDQKALENGDIFERNNA